MPVDLYDAINLFKYSRTGQGGAVVERPHPELARDVIDKLWHLRGCSRIVFADLPPLVVGDSDPGGQLIRVSNRWRDDLAATSLNLVHEAVHCVRPWRIIDEELRCRYLQLSYYEELRQGQARPSGGLSMRLHESLKTVRVSVDPAVNLCHYETQRWLNRNKQLIDWLLEGGIERSRPGQEDVYLRDVTAEWVRRHINDWGGIEKRLPPSKALYIARLAAEAAPSPESDVALMDASIILEILKSIQGQAEWGDITATMLMLWSGPGTIRQALAPSIAHDNPHRLRRLAGDQSFRQQVQALERRLACDLGAGGRSR